ncbi:MAG: C40 family peptidase [Sterolibacteriaceae bacterium]|nr:C40 family peptidase [Sterolibacteriaceae bacterium]MBK9085387.1 C40 family peptidase [Sterolibacteriaceae bacterium]
MARSPSDWKRDLSRVLRPTARGPLVAVLVSLLAGCGTAPPFAPRPEAGTSRPSSLRIERARAQEIVLRTLALIDTGYVFGGSNPEAGLDCSGMVVHVFEQTAGVRLPHNAAQIARLAQPVERERLGPGDLVFFNTRGFSASHVGIYLGDGRFVHAPSSKGRVRIESMDNRYFAARFEGGRTLFVD